MLWQNTSLYSCNKNIHGVELLTYKRNRGITITKDHKWVLHISEQG
ncbi:MAG: hypothetical protein PF442_02650 [Desulfobulbaceae bacterium]|nr:hypothetical protein [Desulfobulbaceae bacterium]